MLRFLNDVPDQKTVRKETKMVIKVGGKVQQDSNSPVGVVRGRVNVHFNKTRNTYRLRFNGVHPDQMEMILLGLEIAREQANTEYDVVALEAMALEFSATYPSSKKPKAASVNLCAKCQAP